MPSKQSMIVWLKFFSGFLCVVYILSLWLTTRCSFQFSFFDTKVILGTATCFGYIILAAASLIFGLLPTLLGMQEARSEGQSRVFFNVVLVLFIIGLLYMIYFYLIR